MLNSDALGDSVATTAPPTPTKARRVSVLVDAVVEADLSAAVHSWHRRTPQDHARRLEALVEEFYDHVRDHRSLDHIRLHVQRVIEQRCSLCEQPWETYVDDGIKLCAHCGEEVEE